MNFAFGGCAKFEDLVGDTDVKTRAGGRGGKFVEIDLHAPVGGEGLDKQPILLQ